MEEVISSDPQRAAFEKAYPDKPFLEGDYFSKGRRVIVIYCGKGRNKEGFCAVVIVVASMSSIIQVTEYDDFVTKYARKGEQPLPAPTPVAQAPKAKPGRKAKDAPILQQQTLALFMDSTGKPFTGKLGNRVFKKGHEITPEPVAAVEAIEPEPSESEDEPNDTPAENIDI